MKGTSIKRLNSLIGASCEYMATVYKIKGWEDVEGTIIISTDSTPISIKDSDMESFLAGLIEVVEQTNDLVISKKAPVALKSVTNETATLLSESLVQMVKEIAEAKTPDQIRNVKSKATAMSNVTNSLVNMAKLELETIKAAHRK